MLPATLFLPIKVRMSLMGTERLRLCWIAIATEVGPQLTRWLPYES